MASHPLPIDTVDVGSSTAAAELDRALRATGFVQLVGHGLDQQRRAAYLAATERFFALPSEVKAGYIHPDSAANRGYRSRGSEALAYSLGQETPPDLFESFNAAPEPAELSPLLQATPWPDDVVPEFSAAALGYYAEMAALAGRLDRIIGEALDIDWLADRSGAGPDMMAAIRYTPGPDGIEETVDGQQRMGAHSDYSSFTVLDADPVPGLQIVGPDDAWVNVVPDEGALLMNVGDLLAVLTNDVWPSTLHRVVPMAAGAAPFRRSTGFFHYPNLDVRIATMDRFVTDDRPAGYDPLTVGDHLLDKIRAPKDKVKSAGTVTVAGRTT